MAEKLVFLYAGKLPSGAQYPTYATTDILKFTNKDGTVGANEFVITPGNYDQYLIGCTSTSLSAAANALITDMLNVAYVVHQACDCNIWFGTPHVQQPVNRINTTVYTGYANAIKYFMTSLKAAYNNKFGANAFNAHVRGFYMNHEHVHSNTTSGSGEENIAVAMNYSNLTAHPEVNMFDIVSQHAQITLGRSFIWVPFYGVGGNYMSTIKDIGYIAGRTGIFNIVFMQPQYYFCFDENGYKLFYLSVLKENLAAVKESMRLNNVVYRKVGSTFSQVCTKTSGTAIGCQMEIDYQHFSWTELQSDANELTTVKTTYDSRFDEYKTTFGSYVDSYPFSFYCGAKEPNDTDGKVADKVHKFYCKI